MPVCYIILSNGTEHPSAKWWWSNACDGHQLTSDTALAMCRGINLMPSLIEYLTSKGSEEEEKRTALLGVLREINNALQKSDGPYFGGKDVNAADLRVAPQLKHVMIGTKAIKVAVTPDASSVPPDVQRLSGVAACACAQDSGTDMSHSQSRMLKFRDLCVGLQDT